MKKKLLLMLVMVIALCSIPDNLSTMTNQCIFRECNSSNGRYRSK